MQQGIGCVLQNACFSPTGVCIYLCGRSLAHQMPAFFRQVSPSTDTAQVLCSRRLLLETSVSLAYASRLFPVSVKHRTMTIGIATATEIGSHRIHIRIHIRPKPHTGICCLRWGEGGWASGRGFTLRGKRPEAVAQGYQYRSECAGRGGRTRISISVRALAPVLGQTIRLLRLPAISVKLA